MDSGTTYGERHKCITQLSGHIRNTSTFQPSKNKELTRNQEQYQENGQLEISWTRLRSRILAQTNISPAYMKTVTTTSKYPGRSQLHAIMGSWLTTRTAVLIQKDQMQGKEPSNYCPIACLATTWKLRSGALADQITQHLNQLDILAYEQKRSRPGCRGIKDQLLIDKVPTADSKIKTPIWLWDG